MFRIYVGNLPYSVKEEDGLKAFFPGATGATVVMTPDGRSKGFGFVDFENENDFKGALAMNGKEMDGRALRIDEARPREDRSGGAAPSAPAPAKEEAAMDDTSTADEDAADAADDDGDDTGDESKDAPAATEDDAADTE